MTNYGTIRSFSNIDFDTFSRDLYQQIEKEIRANSDDYILNVDEQEFLSYLVDKYSLSELNVDKDSEEIQQPREITENLSSYTNPYLHARYGRCRKGYAIDVKYSYTGDGELFSIRPNPHMMTSNEILVEDYAKKVTFTVEIFEMSPEVFEREKALNYDRAFTNIDNLNRNISTYNASLQETIRRKLSSIKEEVKKKNSFFAAINVKKTFDSPDTYGVPIIKKKEVVKPTVGKEKMYSPTPTLAQSTYEQIISEIYQVGTSMERKPSLYQGKDEEALRDVFVLSLEQRFESVTATGETFNHSGKTDILLKNAEDGSNLFIAECKFWHGEKHFLEAISQLFDRYLTWRDTKTALLVFVGGTDFTKVLSSIKAAVPKHPYFKYINEGKHRDSSYGYTFCLPKDKSKDVFLEVMAFNFDKIKKDT